MMIFTRYGIVTGCQVCDNKIWINTDWDGLPKWKIPDTNQVSDIFRCPHCYSLLKMYKNLDNILRYHIVERSNTVRKIDFKYPIIVDEETLISMFENLIKTFVSVKGIGKNKDKVSIEANFNNIQDLRKDLSRRIVSVIKDNRALPIPVLDR